MLRRLLQTETAEYGPDDARPNYVAVILANVVGHLGRPEDAMPMLENALQNLDRALGPSARRTLVAKDQLAGLYFNECKFDAAADLWTQVVAGYEQSGDPAEAHHLRAQTDLALAWTRSGRNEEAERMFRAVLAEQRGKVDFRSPLAQTVRFDLAYVLLAMGKPGEVPGLRQGLDAVTLNMGEQEPDWPGRLMFIDGRLALEQGRRPVAKALLIEAQGLLKTESADGQIKPAVLAPLIREASVEDGRH